MVEEAIIFLRIGTALLFLQTAYLSFKDPQGFVDGFIKNKWIENFLIFDRITSVKLNAVFDIIVGIWLLSGILTWLAAIVAFLHLLFVFTLVGLMDKGAYRDVGMSFCCIALALLTWPD